MSDLDVEIRRAVVELRSAAPRALSVDDLRDRPVAAVRRPVGGVPVRAFAVAAAVVLLVGGLYAVRRVVDARDVTPGTASSSTAPDATATSGSSTSAAVESPPAAILEEPFVPMPVAYGPAATSWLAVVAPLLPEGFHPVLAWSWPAFNSSAYVEAVADDGRWLTVDVGVGGGSETRREINGVGDATAWHSVPEGDLQRHDGGADLVTPAGDVVQVVCRRGEASCAPGAPGAGALAALVQGAARTMDRNQVGVTDADAAADPMPSVTCAQLSVAPSLRALRQLSEVGEPRRAVPCQWDGPSGSLIFVDVALRAAQQGTALGIRRAALRDGIAVNGQGSGSDGFVSVTATIGNGQPIDSDTAAVLVALIDHITIDLIGETGALAQAVHAGTAASPGSTPATASPVVAPAEICTVVGTRPRCDAQGTTSTTSVPATYTVVSGDYLVVIARKLGVSFVALLDENAMSSASLIVPGQQLVVPPTPGTRPMPVGRDSGFPQTLAEVFIRSVPTGFELHEASYGRSSSDLLRFGAGRDGDRLQVLVYASHGGPVPALPFTATPVPAPAGRVQLDVIGEHGWSYMAVALDADGGTAPLNADELTSVVRALDAAVGASA